MNDLRIAFRQLLKNPGFTAVAVLALAVGIGATTAIFSVVYGVVLNPYPYADPGGIWTPGVRTATDDQRMRPYRVDQIREMAEMPVFSEVMATAPDEMLLTGDYAPELLRTVRITGNALGFLGVAPVLGRLFGTGDIRADGEADPVVVLSYRLWQRLFDGQPDALGRVLRLNDVPYTVVGVMPPRFGWWTSDGLWLPMGMNRSEAQAFPIVRLKEGIPASAAGAALQAAQARWAEATPAAFPRAPFESVLTNYLKITSASGAMERSLILLFGAVGFLLLIACANVANLQMARASTRSREMAVRVALGARRGRLIRQLMTESLLLSVTGGLLGLLFAVGITKLMVALMPAFNVPGEARIEVNGYVLLFSLGVSVLTGVSFGLLPAMQSSQPNLTDALKDEARGSSASAGARARAVLVIAEVALSVVLLVSAALTLRGFVALQRVNLGFQPAQVVTAGFRFVPARYDTLEKRNRFALELEQRVRSLPGVDAVSMGNGGMPFGGPFSQFSILGREPAGNESIMIHLAGSEYLKVLRIPLRRGAMFEALDVVDGRRVGVINEAAAKLWPAGEDPIGRTIRIDALGQPHLGDTRTVEAPSPAITVVGIMGDTKNDGVRAASRPAIVVPYTLVAPLGRTLAIRSALEPGGLMNAVRAQVRELDPEQPLRGLTPLQIALDEQTVQSRFTVALFGLFAAFGLSLALAGVYSVLSYLVSRRTREIGVRMALGAGRGQVQRLFLMTGARLVALGLLLGLIGSVAVARVLIRQVELYQVSMLDPLAIAGVAVLLVATGLAACYLPARRATRVDPVVAIRGD